MRPLLRLLVVSLAFFLCSGTLSKSNPKKTPKKNGGAESELPKPPKDASVFDRDLVKERVRVKDVLEHHAHPCQRCRETRAFKSPILAYVTPWNNHGYDVAKTFAKKWTHVSPVWLQLRMEKGLSLKLTGTHDVDAGWMSTLHRKNAALKILPRVLLDGWSEDDYARVLGSEERMLKVAEALNDGVKEFGFDGVVLELTWLGPRRRNDLLHLISHIGEKLRSSGHSLVVVIPPSTTSFGPRDFDFLEPDVDFFSLMTYDYPEQPGPNAPISWVRECVESLVPNDDDPRRAKLVVGLNFYGRRYSAHDADAVLGSQLVERLKQHSFKVSWLTGPMEHKFSRKGEDVYYPTLYSIQKRLELFASMGVGASIWEIGQGLDYFYDLL